MFHTSCSMYCGHEPLNDAKLVLDDLAVYSNMLASAVDHQRNPKCPN